MKLPSRPLFGYKSLEPIFGMSEHALRVAANRGTLKLEPAATVGRMLVFDERTARVRAKQFKAEHPKAGKQA